eukprot:4006410-Prymnesium_polylepis.2
MASSLKSLSYSPLRRSTSRSVCDDARRHKAWVVRAVRFVRAVSTRLLCEGSGTAAARGHRWRVRRFRLSFRALVTGSIPAQFRLCWGSVGALLRLSQARLWLSLALSSRNGEREGRRARHLPQPQQHDERLGHRRVVRLHRYVVEVGRVELFDGLVPLRATHGRGVRT